MPTVTVALLSPPYASLTYLLPDFFPVESWHIGQRVAVPLGKSLRVGVIELISLESKELYDSMGNGQFSALYFKKSSVVKSDDLDGLQEAGEQDKEIRDKLSVDTNICLKPVAWPLELAPVLSSDYLDLARQLALRQTTTLGRILGNILPAGLRSSQVKVRFFGDGKPVEIKLRTLHSAPVEEKETLVQLWQNGQAEILKAGQNPLDTEFCLLNVNPPWPVRPAARKQIMLLDYLDEHGVQSRRKLYEALGDGASAILTTLINKGLVNITKEEVNDSQASAALLPAPDSSDYLQAFFKLTAEQQTVFDPLSRALEEKKPSTHLLFGVTGSGKTAVYLELARKTLSLGRSVMLLAPEVALAMKLWAEVHEAIADAPKFLFHGYQTPSTKEQTFWELSGRTEPCIVVGTRSALLLPLKNIGAIILDEEHDTSFKQDEGFVYQAKEVAWYRAVVENALLILGSATPDVKTFHAALEGRLTMHRLAGRVSGGEMPEVNLVPMPKSAENLLSEESITALKEVVNNGEQVVIMLNRRGYSPVMYCLSCNAVAKCPHCEIALAYHKGRERLLCHYCGFSVPYPSPCQACNNLHFLPMGEGTEKLEEHLSTVLPVNAKVLRLDRDSTRKVGSMEDILRKFAKKEAAVLVGTQMLSKGHHFPDVTLAIVADADLGLNLPDYRAAERTFQLLVQSSGRSGRGQKPGKVLVQTRDPGHYCWEFVRNADYEGFYAREIALRQKRRYPPFVRLGIVRISFPVETNAQDELNKVGEILRKKGREAGLTVLGPAPAPLPVLQGRRRFHCLIKGHDWQALRILFHEIQSFNKPGKLRITLDLDPVNML